MKTKFWIRVLLIAVLSFVFSCKITNRVETKPESANCCQQQVEGINKREILNLLAANLSSLLPDYKGPDKKGFNISQDCHLQGAFIFDLVDTLNVEIGPQGCIRFQDTHIYHFASVVNRFSYSNIAILNKGSIKIFKAINCPGKGDTLQDVLSYIDNSMPELRDKKWLIERVSDYRKYGFFSMEDPHDEFRCE